MNTGLDGYSLSSARRTVVCVVVHTTVKSARCALFVRERTKKMHKIIFSQAEEAQSEAACMGGTHTPAERGNWGLSPFPDEFLPQT